MRRDEARSHDRVKNYLADRQLRAWHNGRWNKASSHAEVYGGQGGSGAFRTLDMSWTGVMSHKSVWGQLRGRRGGRIDLSFVRVADPDRRNLL
jgi:hypothetical protein